MHSIEVGSLVSSDPSTVSAKQKIRNTSAGAANRSGVGEPTIPHLLLGSCKVIEKILIELSLAIRRYNGPEEAAELEEALQRILPEVDRPLRCALTMAYLQGCTDTASVGDRLIAGVDNRTRRAADSLMTSSALLRDGTEVETRFHCLTAGFGYVGAILVKGSLVTGYFIDT